jgi:TldD protein
MTLESYDEIFTIFEEFSNNYKRKDQYFDILYDSVSSLLINKTPSAEQISISPKKAGFVARTYLNSWKEIATEHVSNLEKMVKKLPKVTNMGENINVFEGWRFNKEIKPKINAIDVPIKEKVNKIREIYKFVNEYDERIIQVQIRYLESLTERIFSNNEGCQLRQVIPRIALYIIPIAKEENNVDYDYYTRTGEIGYEVFDEFSNEKLEKVAKSSLEMLKAELPPSGKIPVILDPQMAGLIAHESFGHGLEADQILRDRSYLKNKLNTKVASQICNIFDTPSYGNGIGFYFFDDEGIRAGENLLVENGILKNFIYDRRTATEFNSKPQGNGRRESFAHAIHPRMSNTYFNSGDYEREEMIAEVKNGVIIVHSSFGMEDPLAGALQGTSKKGYLIKNGEIVKPLKSIAISGSVLELLQNIDAISKDPVKLHGGTCGKGEEDHIPVSSGGSYIRIKKALISPG